MAAWAAGGVARSGFAHVHTAHRRECVQPRQHITKLSDQVFAVVVAALQCARQFAHLFGEPHKSSSNAAAPVFLAEGGIDDALEFAQGRVGVGHGNLAAILQSEADSARPSQCGDNGYAAAEVVRVDAQQVRALIGDFALALRERGLWSDGEGPAADLARSNRAEESPEAFCAWIELMLLPHVAAALAGTQRPEPVAGFGAAALATLGHDPANAALVRLAHELEQALKRPEVASPLDEALARAESSAEAADAFYTLFANTRLLVPLATDEAGAAVQDDAKQFAPLTVVVDDVEFMAVFDSPERLQDWAGGEIPHTVMSGMAIAVTLDSAGPVQVVLNPGSGSEKTFVPEELAALRGQLTKVNDDLWLCAAGNVPSEAVQQVCAGLSEVPNVQAAHLAVRLAESEDGAGLLMLAFRTAGKADDALVERVTTLCTAALTGFHLELLFCERDEHAEAVAQAVPAFYTVV